jgi:cytochrome d ubiquinol oxidase subunit I
MPFQIGTNWSRYSDATANVVGPLLAYEGLTAFFLEAAFLGVLLFGRKLVPPWGLWCKDRKQGIFDDPATLR